MHAIFHIQSHFHIQYNIISFNVFIFSFFLYFVAQVVVICCCKQFYTVSQLIRIIRIFKFEHELNAIYSSQAHTYTHNYLLLIYDNNMNMVIVKI